MKKPPALRKGGFSLSRPLGAKANAMPHYIAIVHKDPDSDFGVSFPDFPGCISAGSTLHEAVAMGAEALRGHVALMLEDGVAIPEPSTVEAAMADSNYADGVPVLIAGPGAPRPAQAR